MRKFIVALVAVFALVTCGGGVKKRSSSSSPAVNSTVITVDSTATEYAVQIDGGNEVWMEKSSGTFTTSISNLADGVHFIECIDEEANRQEVCDNVYVEGFRQCTYVGDLRYKVRFTKPVTKDDDGCDTVVPPPLPPNPPPPPPPPGQTPVAVTNVTFTFCSYDTSYAAPLTAFCSFSGSWLGQTMALDPSSSCQSTTFNNVPTNRTDYGCNVCQADGSNCLFNPSAITQPNNIFFANGVQLGDSVANDLRVSIDPYGQVASIGRSYTFTIYPATVLQGPVYMQIGHGSGMQQYLMSPIGGGWQVTVYLSYGLYEVNFTRGLYVFLDPSRDPGFEDGTFYVHDGVTTTLPGQRILATESIMYASVPTQQTLPSYITVTQMRYLVNLSIASINGRIQSIIFLFSYNWPGP